VSDNQQTPCPGHVVTCGTCKGTGQDFGIQCRVCSGVGSVLLK
jgi:DnaJ-class molecular chaperone